MNQDGYSLITFLLYIGLFSLLATVLLPHAITMQQKLITQQQKVRTFLQITAAGDVLTRDISMLPYGQSIKKINSSEYVWQRAKNYIGWHTKEGRLIRSTGIYDIHNNTWQKRTKSLIATDIKHFSIKVTDDKKTIKETTIIITHNNKALKPIKRTVVLEHGIG